MESIRDSLAEELVKECEKLRSEVSQLPGMKAEMEALRLRHAAALELMGERDEEDILVGQSMGNFQIVARHRSMKTMIKHITTNKILITKMTL
ncbi:hypothetical protein HanRHA438_Chr06g0274171 [Helianthus annuus]|nr:hypothetical protein HanRHA438_Chr06g0274171 [Helianthus annuus]